MSCLFRSLAAIIKTDDEDIIRQKICNYLICNRPLSTEKAADYILWESNMDLVSYVTKMRNHSEWGGAIEIQGFCELYNYEIEVINIRSSNSSGQNDIIQFVPTRKNQGALKFGSLTWNGGHYEPLK